MLIVVWARISIVALNKSVVLREFVQKHTAHVPILMGNKKVSLPGLISNGHHLHRIQSGLMAA
jgi:hypothetical protein